MLKCNFCFHVNDRFGPTWCVTLYISNYMTPWSESHQFIRHLWLVPSLSVDMICLNFICISQVAMPTDSAKCPQCTPSTLKWMRSASVRDTWTLPETNSGSITTQGCLLLHDKVKQYWPMYSNLSTQERVLTLMPMSGQSRKLSGKTIWI